MALYQFFCEDCGKQIELYKSMKEEHKANCPDCGSPARRIFQPVPFKFGFKYGYDPGLGAYCDTQKDKEEIMRRKNLIEQ